MNRNVLSFIVVIAIWIIVLTIAIIAKNRSENSTDLPDKYIVVKVTNDHEVVLKSGKKTITLFVENAYDHCFQVNTVIFVKNGKY